MRFLFVAAVLVSGCAEKLSPELTCQQRIVDIAAQPGPQTAAEAEGNPDPFQHQAYAAIDRTGCTTDQLAKLDRIVALAKALPELSRTNNEAGENGNDAAHMEAFQRMNNAVIELDDLQQGAKSDLETMMAKLP